MGCGVCANGKDVGIGILILDSQGRIAATATQMGGWFLTRQHTIICALVRALRFAQEMSFSSIALGMTSSSQQDLMNKTRHSVFRPLDFIQECSLWLQSFAQWHVRLVSKSCISLVAHLPTFSITVGVDMVAVRYEREYMGFDE